MRAELGSGCCLLLLEHAVCAGGARLDRVFLGFHWLARTCSLKYCWLACVSAR